MRLFELARLQLVGFFSMLIYDEAAKRGYQSDAGPGPLRHHEDEFDAQDAAEYGYSVQRDPYRSDLNPEVALTLFGPPARDS